ANSTSTGQLDKLVSAAIPALTPESEEERSLPPQRVSTFRPRPYSMADSNKVRYFKLVEGGQLMCPHSVMFCCDLRCRQLITFLWFADYIRFSWFPTITHQVIFEGTHRRYFKDSFNNFAKASFKNVKYPT
ncbi:hypothetical protein XENOCAPTIV_016062, partial [Xenoophorus captivus]